MNENNYQLITFTEDGLSLDVRVDAEKETVWLTQAEMAELFGVNVDTIGLHLRNIYREEELETSTYEESSVVRFESNVRKTHFANVNRQRRLSRPCDPHRREQAGGKGNHGCRDHEHDREIRGFALPA